MGRAGVLAAHRRRPSGRSAGRRCRAAFVAVLATPPAGAPVDLGPHRGRLHPGPHPGLGPQATEQPGLGLLQHLELGLALVHAQLVKGRVLRLFDGPPCDLDPFHA